MTPNAALRNADNGKKALLGLSTAEIAGILPDAPAYTAKQIRAFCFAGKEIPDMTSVSAERRTALREAGYVANPVTVERVYASRDGSKKYLFRMRDGNLVEGVFMPHDYGASLCVSTQVGCRMGCAFCASGKDGLVRNLDFSEILGQVVAVNASEGGTVKNRAVVNVVLMGSGEPLDNYDNVTRFLAEVSAADGLNISERNISLSTSGLVDGIRRLADSGSKVTLSISLHSPFDEERKKIMPVAKKYSVSELTDAAKYYFTVTGRRVIFEYTLIKGVNDSDACAKRLHELTRGFPCHINLIRLNEVKGSGLERPRADAADAFLKKLLDMGVSATLRRSFGEDIAGACGQLRRRVIDEETAAERAAAKSGADGRNAKTAVEKGDASKPAKHTDRSKFTTV